MQLHKQSEYYQCKNTFWGETALNDHTQKFQETKREKVKKSLQGKNIITRPKNIFKSLMNEELKTRKKNKKN